MSNYFFVHSRDPFSDRQGTVQFNLARELVGVGSTVTIMLTQNAVCVARKGAFCSEFDGLKSTGITLLVDRFAMAQREIATHELKSSVQDASIRCVVEAMLRGDKVIWH